VGVVLFVIQDVVLSLKMGEHVASPEIDFQPPRDPRFFVN